MSAENAQGAQDQVSATLALESGQATGILLEMGPRTVGLLFLGGALAGAELGARGTVTLKGEGVGGEHSASGHILGVHDEERGRRVTIRYADVDDYEKLLATGVGRNFNRRTSFRIEPDHNRPVTISITDSENNQFTGRAMDLSATGMALVIDGDMDLTSGQTLQLKFSVQWDPKPLNFAGRVCYCGMRDGDLRYGIDFVEHQTPNFEEEQDRLVDYVMTRQREVLRRAAQVEPDDTSGDESA